MAGIYIHIPFCSKKCFYCDFHKSTSLIQKNEILSGIHQELLIRKDYLQNDPIETIYFGGGTPSLLQISEIESLLKALYSLFNIIPKAEITLEANPDDLSNEYCQELIHIGINRLSIGIQSFNNKDLKLMNRRHNEEEAINAVLCAQNAGFKNISIDLIYGLPGMTTKEWEVNLSKAFSLNIQHLSAYLLTYHPGTVFYQFLQDGKISIPPEDECFRQFEMLTSISRSHGFIQYEISNFGLPDYFSKHNSSYWKNKKYLGLGPSAHSFDGVSRQWNISNNQAYLNAIQNQKPFFEKELLSLNDRFNDYVITSLRTLWGLSLPYINKEFGPAFRNHTENIYNRFKETGHLIFHNETITLSSEGLFVSDDLMSEFIIV